MKEMFNNFLCNGVLSTVKGLLVAGDSKHDFSVLTHKVYIDMLDIINMKDSKLH